MYGKIIGGKMCEAPNILNKDGRQYINPPEQLYLEYGYLPLEYTIIPDVVEGYHLVQSWINMGDRLVQKWNYEANGIEDTSILQNKINQLEELINSLKNPYGIQSEEFPEGDYMNPIHLIAGGLTTTKNKWYYVENKNKPHRAIAVGFVTVNDFDNKMWFDFN